MSKNIVVCMDGTANQQDTQNTNLARVIDIVSKTNTPKHYFSGIGVRGRGFSNSLDWIFGRGGFATMREAFTFVKANYEAGDNIYIFGFSRGSFFAYHLAGMIASLGFHSLQEKTFTDYLQYVLDDTVQAQRGVPVKFLGLFDSVPGNQFYMLNRKLHPLNKAKLHGGVEHFRHAVAKEERRWSFRPLLYDQNGQTTFEQRWFPGYHFDVGGDNNCGLNNFALLWMLRAAYGIGLELENLNCSGFGKHSKLAKSISWISSADETATPNPSDYLTTKLGLKHERTGLPEYDSVDPPPNWDELNACPRGCGDPFLGL